jgi:hypothetical protein
MANFKPTVRKAKRYKVKAAIMLEGLTGNGKTGLALCLAKALAGGEWEKVGLIDTENKSADLLVGQHLHTGDTCGEFYKVDLTPDIGYAPLNYLAAAKVLQENGCEAIIFDSSTHAWNRAGGVLDLVNKAEESGAVKKNDKFSAWRLPEVSQNKDALFELLRSSDYHVITTVRVKEKFDMQADEQTGRNRVVSMGEQQVQTEGLKYEPDLVLNMLEAGSTTKAPKARVVKSRYPMLAKDEVYDFTPELIEQIRLFLEEGADPAELLRMQHEEYETAVVNFCKDNPTQKTVWVMIKQSYGLQDTPIAEVPLKVLKAMFMQLTADTGGR